MQTLTPEQFKERYGTAGMEAFKTPSKPKAEGLGSRIGSDIKQRGANIYNEITNSNQNPVIGGIKATGQAFSAVGDVAGEVVKSTPGLNKVSEFVGDQVKKGFNATTDAISETKLFKEASMYPEQTKILEDYLSAGGSLGDIANNILLAKGTADTAQGVVNLGKKTLTKAGEGAQALKKSLTPTAEQIATERRLKMEQGLNEQNVRLKSADKAFTKNTIVRKSPDGKTTTITPIDTFTKNDIAPVIDKGSIQMGDYKTGVGELGKIKVKVSDLDDQITSKLAKSGQKISIDDLEMKAFESVMKNAEFRQSGTVSQMVAKLESRFNDYRSSYGDAIDIAELNNIRKTANLDYSPDTQDISRIMGDTAREVVYKATPDGAVKKLLQQQGELLAAKKYAEAINGTKVTGGRLGNMALRTAGAVAGTTVKELPVVGPVLGMIGGEFAARALQQSQFKSLWTELRALLLEQAKNGQK